MASQEEFRQQAYQEWVGRTGNNSIGTQANQRGYNDYLRQQGSTWTPSTGGTTQGTRGYDAGTSSGGGKGRSASGPGLFDSGLDGLAWLSQWFVAHLWPLRMAEKLGSWIVARSWKVRLPVAVMGAFLGAGLLTGETAVWAWAQTTLVELFGAYAVVAALGVGALGGWWSFDVVGLALTFAVYVVGLAFGLAVVALVAGFLYAIIGSIAGWPPFDEAAGQPVEDTRPAPGSPAY